MVLTKIPLTREMAQLYAFVNKNNGFSGPVKAWLSYSAVH
jgi:hypothetical protein